GGAAGGAAAGAGGPGPGVAVWRPPGPGAPLGERLRQLPAVVRAIGLRHLPTAAGQRSRYERHRPRRAHWVPQGMVL
ncbi:hypothetical protein, partial [Cellulomonas sp. GbtcB1]|uniref:hypothetical protein n=1 Tax=Cellulomonas sp. GbtcB1 TaxID=2824746 RepID=UPI001C306244